MKKLLIGLIITSAIPSIASNIKSVNVGESYWFDDGCLRGEDYNLVCMDGFQAIVEKKNDEGFPIIRVLTGTEKGFSNVCHLEMNSEACDDSLPIMKTVTPQKSVLKLYDKPKLYRLSRGEVYTCIGARLLTKKKSSSNLENDFFTGQKLTESGYSYRGWFGGIAGNTLELFDARSYFGLHDPGCNIREGDEIIVYGTETDLYGEERYIVKAPKFDSYHNIPILPFYYGYISMETELDYVKELNKEELEEIFVPFNEWLKEINSPSNEQLKEINTPTNEQLKEINTPTNERLKKKILQFLRSYQQLSS